MDAARVVAMLGLASDDIRPLANSTVHATSSSRSLVYEFREQARRCPTVLGQRSVTLSLEAACRPRKVVATTSFLCGTTRGCEMFSVVV